MSELSISDMARPAPPSPYLEGLNAEQREAVVIFRDDCFYDERLVEALLDASDTLVCQPAATGG